MDLRNRSLLCALCICPALNAQNVLDGAYIKEHTPTRRAVPYVHLREADVLFAKRVWHTLDLREKLNHPLFWLYFPELRYGLTNAESFNRSNDGERRSLDHLFQDRLFSSWITKESNVYDRRIGDHAKGLDALLEAGRAKDGLFRFEHDLWNC